MAKPRKKRPPTGRPIGRPSKYKPEYCKQAAHLCKLGATDREMAEFFAVSEATLNTWKIIEPDFLEALKRSKAHSDNRVEISLYRRAVGYSYDSVKIFQYEGVPVEVPYVEHVPPDVTAQIFWLKNRRKEQWRDRHDTTLSNPPGETFRTDLPAPELLGPYYARLEALALERSAVARSGAGVGEDRGDPEHPGSGKDDPRARKG